jgi:NADH:ubiquinone oxidoreductase subunit 2 (subunit N)
MLNSSFDAIVPMLCVTAGALVVMLAEAWRNRDERMPLGVLGIIALVFAGVAMGLLWDRNTTGFNVIVADNFGLFVSIVLVIVGILSIVTASPPASTTRSCSSPSPA